MDISTSRFGNVEIDAQDIIQFPEGLIGFENAQNWVVLSDESNDAIGWLQSIDEPDLAMAVVSPRRFSTEYRVRTGKSEIEALELSDSDDTFVLAIVSKHEEQLTINLRAPLIINLSKQVGKQVVTTDEQPLQYVIASPAAAYRKSA
ncbi:MAG: hypothetical protein COA78_31575 [Blastopirellula sp.]|nr:MAG: hypothetical protein COA78_31575 [Blastopirellula sp.]